MNRASGKFIQLRDRCRIGRISILLGLHVRPVVRRMKNRLLFESMAVVHHILAIV